MNEDIELLGARLVDDRITGEYDSFKIREIFFIDVFQPKKNYFVPRFHTAVGVFTVLLTLESCKFAFPEFKQLDNGNLVNLKRIKMVTETNYAITAHFDNNAATCNVARAKRKYVEHLFQKKA
ncbi:LytTR family transcriptional regulator DNA-binding domain-containing protein [Paenibacillus popilliae]|uniref:Dipeptidyl aminopeptidase/acylaminoacyl-peptidase n=1 Tax=Paenibacillus popilliae ATCC 14706 TaxID=1212764 RepID=M9LRX4_PAEPP|nr:LytTR family transcriptional regulator DNA-binding domain-containing protein [Paenibacillus popilliae]GAC44351.1 dipeptidyl aminopeptidase/acylaminoacyl-peptidase [Paenibacillus popilliae ATCC 14706]